MIRRRRHVLGALAVTAGLAMAAPALAQSTATVSATGSADIFQPIAISKDSDLTFGTIIKPVSGSGTVTVLATTGVRQVDPGVGTLRTASRAAYTVTGEGGQTFSIGIPASVTMNRTGGGTLSVTLASSAATGALSGSIGSSGSATFGVGGTFTVDAATTTGAYTGTFTVTVNYQ